MGMKTSGSSYFGIPTMPAAGTGVTTGAANTYGSWTQLLSSTSAPIYIVGFMVQFTVSSSGTYIVLKLGVGAAASETEIMKDWPVVGSGTTGAGLAGLFSVVFPEPIPVATGTRIAAQIADSVGSRTYNVTLVAINQADYVTDGIGGGATAAQVWDYLTSAIATSGSIGKLLKDDIDIVLSSGIQARLPSALVSGRMDSSVGAVAANAIADAGLATDLDTYQAQIVLVKTALANHYTVIFYLNGQPITSGITSPTIQVIKASDGSDLVASTALTQIASTQTWKYDDSVNLVVAGSAYVAKVQATIDGATRTWEQPVGASA